MPNFRTHRLFNYLVFIIGCLLLYKTGYFNVPIIVTIGIGFIIGTEMMTPDLDIKSTPSRRMGILWYPYRMIFKHRGTSHNYIIGFIIQVIYILILMFIILSTTILIFRIDMYTQFIRYILNPPIIAIIFVMTIGIMLANSLHIFLDRMRL